MKKIIAIALSLMLMVSLFSFSAFAAETVTINVVRGGGSTLDTLNDTADDLANYTIKSPEALGIVTYGETPTITVGLLSPVTVEVGEVVDLSSALGGAIVNYSFSKPAPSTYSITTTDCFVTNSPMYGGTAYAEGELVIVEAQRITGKKFVDFTVTGDTVTLAEVPEQPYQKSFNMPAKDLTIVANYVDEPVDFVVTFHNEGGKFGDLQQDTLQQTIAKDALVSAPTDVTKEHCHFNGWFVDDRYSAEFDFSQPITENTDVYSLWYEEPSITLDANGGTVDGQPTTRIYAVNRVIESFPTPIREGFTFEGWYKDDIKYERLDFSNIEIYPDPLVAKWTEIPVTPAPTPAPAPTTVVTTPDPEPAPVPVHVNPNTAVSVK